jgi:hypothetical protein
MPLTPEKVAFLGPTVREYANVQRGPGWSLLDKRGVTYLDILWLMEVYPIIDPPRLTSTLSPDGQAIEALVFGRSADPLPHCPWPDAETARQQSLEIEVQAPHSASREGVPT